MIRVLRAMAWGFLASIVLLDGKGVVLADTPEAVKDRSPYDDRVIREELGELADTFEHAQEAIEGEDWQAGVQGYAAVLAERPDFVPALTAMASAKLELGEVDEAVRIAREASGDDAPAEVLFRSAQVLGEAAGRGAGVELKAEADALLERAYRQAIAGGFAYSEDEDRLTIVALLALDHQNEEDFRSATANLVRLYPEEASSQYFNGLRAAMDGEWITSKRALNRAVALGIPQEMADQLLDAGVRTRANIWLGIYGTAIACVVWAVGMVLLFVAGKGLSVMTVRSIERDDPNGGITPWQRSLRRVYAGVIAFTGLYYYISIPVVIVLALAVAAGLVIGTLMLPSIPVKLIAIVICFALAMLAMAFSMIRSIFVRVKREVPGRVLEEHEAPALWSLAREVAEAVGTRPIDEIRLTDDAALAVTEQGTARQKARDEAKRTLILGMDVLPGFPLDAFRAVLAHEYGHFLHRDTAGGDSAMRTNTSMARFAEAMFDKGMTAWWNLGWHFLRVYHLLFRRVTFGASRLHEIHADRVAVRCFGPDAFTEGLSHAIRRSIESDAERSISLGRATSPGTALATMDHRSSLLQRAGLRRSVHEVFEKIWQSGTSEDDTHPSPVERIRQARRLDVSGHATANPESAGDVLELFADPDRLRNERAELRTEQEKAQVDAHFEYRTNIRHSIDAYLKDNVEGPGSPYFERGVLRHEQGEYEGAEADYAEAIRLDGPNKAAALFNRGLVLQRLGRSEEAARSLAEAMAVDPSMAIGAHVNRGEMALDGGDPDRAIVEYEAAMAASEADPNPDLLFRRAEALERLGQFDRALNDLDEALRIDPNFAEALVARAQIRSRLGRFAEALADGLEALRIDPSSPDVRLQLAWMRATSPESSLRDGRAAVSLASRAVETLGEDDWAACDTLAAAWAEQGDFQAAISWAERAVNLAPESEAVACRGRLDDYRAGRPTREPAPSRDPLTAPRA